MWKALDEACLEIALEECLEVDIEKWLEDVAREKNQGPGEER